MPSAKVTTHFLLGAALAVAGYLAKDTTWTGWVPTQLAWLVPLALQALAAVGAYYKSETRPAPSSSPAS